MGIFIYKETTMQANLARKNRRIPVLCMFFLLLSTLTSAIGSLSSFVFPAIWKLKELQGKFSITDLIRTVATALANNAVTISAIFFLLIVLVLLFKPKGWAISIPAFLSSIFMLSIGIVVAATSLTLLISLINGSIPNGESDTIPSAIIDIIICLLPASISFSWAALGFAGISSIILHKTAKKAIRYSFGALTVAFGIISSGMFVISSLGNVLAAIKEIIAFAFYDSIGFTACTFAPVFIFANLLGFIGIILLTVYIIKPYKKTFLPHETDPEIIYAIDEDDPVFHEIDGTAKCECCECCEAEAEKAEEEKAEAEPTEPKEKKKCPLAFLKKWLSCRTRSFKIALALLIAALILEPGALIIPGIGIASIIIMLRASKRPTVIVLGIVNMVLGGGPISLVAGIFMLFIPEASLLEKAPKCTENVAEAKTTATEAETVEATA